MSLGVWYFKGQGAMFSIAVVDDDLAIRELLRDVLTDEGYVPHLFDGMDGTYQGIRAVSPSVIILDLPSTQSGAAWALLNRLSTDPVLAHAAIVVCSGDDAGLAEQSAALQRHTYAVLPTPFDLNDLAALLQRLIHHTARAYDRAARVS